jgi:phospholipase/carboxylesterase
MTPRLDTIEIETAPKPEAAVIWLHGLGADGNDFVPIVDELDLSGLQPLRFVFPHAPTRPVTINGGMVMRAWYDILSLDFASREEDANGIRASAEILERLIRRENDRGIDDTRIVVAGFSQGGAIVLQGGLRHPTRLAGILALSTYLPLASTLDAEASPANRDVPLFMGHGMDDDVIPHRFSVAARDRLSSAGYRLEWRDYEMGHAVCMQEIRDVGDWLRGALSPTAPLR